MSMKYREWLVFVAIVTSAIVMHIRQETLDAESMQRGPQTTPSVQRETCDPTDEGRASRVIAASCNTPRRQQQPVDERNNEPAFRRHPLMV